MSKLHIAPCTCDHCISACKRNPGWFSPSDAKLALDAGLASKMMLDYWAGETVYILAPASEGQEGKLAQFGDPFAMLLGDWCKGQCVLLKDDRCTIHDSGYKPYQCINLCNNKTIRDLWDNDEGRSLIQRWRDEVDCREEV